MSMEEVPSSPEAPGLEPPPGTTSYLNGAFTLQPYLAVEVAAAAILTTVMVIARVYTKVKVMKSVTLEDYACVIGWAFYIAFIGIQYSCGRHGQGTHQWNVPYKNVQYNWQYSNYGDMLYSISLLSVKLSILLIIQRIFCSVRKNIPYYLIIFLIAVNTGFYIAFLIVPAAQCIPRTKIWNPDAAGHCIQPSKLYIASGIFNFISDIAMLSVPLYLVWNLQMSMQRKIGISIVFGTGGLACIAAICRIIYNTKLGHTKDYTYTHAQPTMWSIAEIAFGLICTNLVVLPRLLQHLKEIIPSTTHSSAAAKHLRNNSKNNGERGKAEWSQLDERQDGRSKGEWARMEERADSDHKFFREEAKLGDEEALDQSVRGTAGLGEAGLRGPPPVPRK